MGYAWNGVCYQDTASALSAFVKDIPSANAAGISSFTAPPSIDGGGVVSWSIAFRPYSGASASTVAGTTPLPSCSEGMDQWPVQSLLFYAALFFAAFIGFRTGFRA